MAFQMPSQNFDGGVRRNRRQRSGITRVRTGCLTCRRRRKKCDERHPKCLNCEKTNVYCEGFPQAIVWEARTSLRRNSNSRCSWELSPTSPTATINTPVHSPPSYEAPPGPSPSLLQSSSYYYAGAENNVGLEPDFDVLFGQHEASSPFGSPSSSSSVGTNNLLGSNYVPQSQELILSCEANTPLCSSLPFLISGVDTPIHRRLFCHFAGVMTSILTTFADDCNPFKKIVIPLALGDRTVMTVVLCIAGSHLLKGQKYWTLPDVELVNEKSRLHDVAVQTQLSRMKEINGLVSDLVEHEALLATSLLLCVYEICEGTGNDGWRIHLDTARHIINLASTTTSPASSISKTVRTELNPFLLEFFVYHESLATVTVPHFSPSSPHFDSLDGLPVQNASLVGVQDGLIEFIERISALRRQAEASESRPDGEIVCRALAIWKDLNSWKPDPSWSKPRRLITTFYQYALFIWLFSIIYPDQQSSPKVQSAVRHVLGSLPQIQPRDGVMACLLFPLFIVATAAITSEDRNIISAQFKRLQDWSALGNVDLTLRVVMKMWKDRDEEVPGSWDWVKQMQNHNLSFMVT